jgi:hypothetical protein
MQYFRNMQELENTDITRHPAYNNLSDEQRKKVAETYTNTFNNNQGRLGIKIAQGIAFETAKRMCESFDAAPGTIADETGVDTSISKPGPTYEWQTAKQQEMTRHLKYKDTKDGTMPSDEEVKAADARRKAARLKENAAEFQANNDAMVGMNDDLVGITEDGVLPSADPEEGGAAHLLDLNHNAKCMNCGVVHPADVLCYNGREHSEAGTGTGAAEILKQNHASKGMKTEESDPLISGAAAFLTHRAKINGIMESVEERPYEQVDEKYMGFDKLKKKLAHEKGVSDPAGLAAAIGKKKYGSKDFNTHKHMGEEEQMTEAIEQMWAENFYPAKPLEESCGNCGHPQSYHGKCCMTCNECEQFTTEINESKKNEKCFCGHEFGHHSKEGCKSCKKEGYMAPGMAAHQFKSGGYAEKFESEYAQIFAAQQGKINMANANASLNWLPEELELAEGNGYDDIGPGDHVKFNHPLRGSDKVPQQGKGRVVMKGTHGWVVNAGGKHGTPQVVTRDNYVSHRKAKKTVKEEQIQESTDDYHGVLTRHGYKQVEDGEHKRYEHKDTSHVNLYKGGDWQHKGKNKSLIGNSGSDAKSLDQHLKKVARAKASGANRKERDDVMRSMGLNKVRGSQSGKTYWEETDPLMAASLAFIQSDVERSGGKLFKITEEDMKRPPNLHEATGDEKCGNCAYFGDNKCNMYGGYPVDSDDVCDEYVKK